MVLGKNMVQSNQEIIAKDKAEVVFLKYKDRATVKEIIIK